MPALLHLVARTQKPSPPRPDREGAQHTFTARQRPAHSDALQFAGIRRRVRRSLRSTHIGPIQTVHGSFASGEKAPLAQTHHKFQNTNADHSFTTTPTAVSGPPLGEIGWGAQPRATSTLRSAPDPISASRQPPAISPDAKRMCGCPPATRCRAQPSHIRTWCSCSFLMVTRRAQGGVAFGGE